MSCQDREGLTSLAASALSGRLFLEGRLGGRLTSPEVQLDARIEGAALGATQLKRVRHVITSGGGRGGMHVLERCVFILIRQILNSYLYAP